MNIIVGTFIFLINGLAGLGFVCIFSSKKHGMGKAEKLLNKILSGTSDHNIRFSEVRNLLNLLGLQERIRGSHHIFEGSGVKGIINLQPDQGKVKPYQVKQVRDFIKEHGLQL